jgi:hypothetical protein
MTRPVGRKLSFIHPKAPAPLPLHAAVKESGVVPSHKVRRLKELMEIAREPWLEGEESVWPMLEACLAKVAEHDGEPTEAQARREDAFAYMLEVLRNQAEDAASANGDEEITAHEVSDLWP